jgi:hypothetical protein
VSDHAGKKAELDKDGISFEQDKAELDKNGISLSDEEYVSDPDEQDTQPSDAGETANGTPQRFKALLIASLVGVILLGSGAILWNTQRNISPAPVADTYVDLSEPETMYSPEGDIVLDPFMILLNSHTPHESGLLLAQLSLQITPETAANIESTIFAVRSLILERLSTNAQIYSKNELAEMLKQDLQDFKVKDVAFIQYELR